MKAVVEVAPALISWAIKRSGRPREHLEGKFPGLTDWEAGITHPSYPQLRDFARATYTPVGYFFLETPPEEPLPIPDFRTKADAHLGSVSANLRDVIDACLRRQTWYSEYRRREVDVVTNHFVGSINRMTSVRDAAESISTRFGFEVEKRSAIRSWSEAFRGFRTKVEDQGILVMASGVVGNNTHRPLDPDEFRGFALADNLAPVIFVNTADSQAAQIFTLMHELVHLGLGQSALNDVRLADHGFSPASSTLEGWCNLVAAEILVPELSLQREYIASNGVAIEQKRLARKYRVSEAVVLRRLRDTKQISDGEFWPSFKEAMSNTRGTSDSGGGDAYRTIPLRASRTFALALLEDTFRGETGFTEAAGLLGVSSYTTVEELGHRMGVA